MYLIAFLGRRFRLGHTSAAIASTFAGVDVTVGSNAPTTVGSMTSTKRESSVDDSASSSKPDSPGGILADDDGTAQPTIGGDPRTCGRDVLESVLIVSGILGRSTTA